MARTAVLDKTCANPSCAHKERVFYLRPDGKPHSRCVPCFKQQSLAAYRRKRDSRLERMRTTYAEKIESRRQRDRDRYETRKPVQAVYMREWRKENRAKLDQYEAVRRARAKGSTEVEAIDRNYVYERDGGRCHICGEQTPTPGFTLDHLVPLSRGGAHTYENLRVAHRVCNSRMGVARLPAQLLLVG